MNYLNLEFLTGTLDQVKVYMPIHPAFAHCTLVTLV